MRQSALERGWNDEALNKAGTACIVLTEWPTMTSFHTTGVKQCVCLWQMELSGSQLAGTLPNNLAPDREYR